VIAIASGTSEKLEFADTFIYGIEGPEALIDAVRGLLSQPKDSLQQ
jgi:hypothetical protein